jgi:transposase
MTPVIDSQPEIAAWIGLDWADQQHVVCLGVTGSSQLETAVVDQKPEALQEWVSQLRRRFGGRRVAIALEQSRGPLIYALMHVDFLLLYPVNPQTLAKYRKAFYSSGAKDDPGDARLLLDLLLKHRDHLRVWVPDDEATRCLELLVEMRRQLVDQRTALTNQLTGLLKGYYPQALEWAGQLGTARACDFLERWPNLAALQRSSPGAIRKFYRDHGYRGAEKIEQRIAAIAEAQPLTEDCAVIVSSSLMAQALTCQIRDVAGAIERFDRQIKERFEQHDDYTLFDSFPGAGPALAPRLLAALGTNRDRFESALEIQQLSGIAPVTERSGSSCWVHWRLACPKFLRQSFQEFAAQSIHNSLWASAYYDQLRARGQSHHAAVRALAYKWIRIIFKCWKEHTPYHEQRYLAALERRGSPLWQAIAPQLVNTHAE